MRRKKIGYGRMQSKSVGRSTMGVVLPSQEGRWELLELVVVQLVEVGRLSLVSRWVVSLARGRELVTILRRLKFRG
jgi:hypothetical protein